MKIENFIRELKFRLLSDLPGHKTQKLMRAKPHVKIHYESSLKNAIPASVLILFFQSGDNIKFILTERTHNVDTHKGQISLPGGMQEKNESLEKTAIRETDEEIGVREKDINIIGSLSSLYVPVSGFNIYPWIGWTGSEPKLKLNPREVESAFSVSISDLLDDNKINEEEWNLYGMPIDVPFFLFHRFKVWGATAMILSELKQVIKDL